jgi:ribosomal protein L37AE/L43A
VSMKCKSCSRLIPTKRIELGFIHCTDCSTVDTYGTVGITYHKTGNTVQHVSKETAANINKAARRNTYGSNLGNIKGDGYKEFSGKLENSGASLAFVGSQQMFKRIGEEAMFKLDLLGLDKALDYIKRKYESTSLTFAQYEQLKNIISSFTLSK